MMGANHMLTQTARFVKRDVPPRDALDNQSATGYSEGNREGALVVEEIASVIRDIQDLEPKLKAVFVEDNGLNSQAAANVGELLAAVIDKVDNLRARAKRDATASFKNIFINREVRQRLESAHRLLLDGVAAAVVPDASVRDILMCLRIARGYLTMACVALAERDKEQT